MCDGSAIVSLIQFRCAGMYICTVEGGAELRKCRAMSISLWVLDENFAEILIIIDKEVEMKVRGIGECKSFE